MAVPLRNRTLAQWTLGYLMSAWLVLEATGELSGMFGWPPTVQRAVFVLLVFGLLSTVVLAWFHGEQGRQKVSRLEVVLLSAIALGAIVSATAVARSSDDDAVTLPVASASQGARSDSIRYAILPFRSSQESASSSVELLLYDALARWQGLDLVDPLRVEEILGQDADPPATLTDILRSGSRIGAGRLVTGEVAALADVIRLRVTLHDASTGRILSDTTARLPLEALTADSVYHHLGDRLLFGGLGLGSGSAEPTPGTTSFHARVAFLRGMQALRNWDLAEAEAHLAQAGLEDPGYARAHLWRAQVLHWQDRQGTSLLGSAERAATGRDDLTTRESLLLDGLLRLTRGDFPAACSTYDQLRARDPSDFAAWYGLANCHRRDDLVVRDSSSPSGWAFRSSYHQASLAYQRAFQLLPANFEGFSIQAFQLASQGLFTHTSQVRVGRAPPPDSSRFVAYPDLKADTLHFVPYPVDDFVANRGTAPSARWEAVERQRRLLLGLAAGWLSTYPSDPGALEAYALTLDLLGDPASLDSLRSARRLAVDPEQDRRLALLELPRIVKYAAPDRLDELHRVRPLADTLLSSRDRSNPSRELASIAGLTGRVFLAAEIERRYATPIEFPMQLPEAATAPAAALVAYAAMGGPVDSIHAYEDQVVLAVENRVPPERQGQALHYLLDRPATLAFPVTPLDGTISLARTTDYATLRAMGSLAEGRPDDARRWVPGVAGQSELRPSDNTPDVLLPNVWLTAELGDTTAAIEALDATLGALRWLSPRSLDDVALAGALIRMMAFRAELAAARGDPEQARSWARAVSILWEDADPPLRPLTERMRGIASDATDLPDSPPDWREGSTDLPKGGTP
ncbi:MAG: hypothetical protein R3304_11270 [Longimicrobiales bacterium]|nr:hypothetical protein [Longimicrobiales bacterium]